VRWAKDSSGKRQGECALLDSIADLLPLLLSRINTSGVVSTSVEKEDTAIGGSLDISNQTLKVQADGFLVVVAVLLNLEAGVVEDGLVVSPRRLGNVDLLFAREELGEESGTDTESTGTRDGLSDGDAVQGGAVGAVGQLSGGGRELRNTSDAGVLLVQLGLDDLLLSLTNGREHVGLASIVTVGTDTQVDLLVELVGLEGFSNTKNGIRRTLGDVGPVGGSANGSQVVLSRTDSPTAGDSKGGQHFEGDDAVGWLMVEERLSEKRGTKKKKRGRRRRIT
jgi:hypothetical protein